MFVWFLNSFSKSLVHLSGSNFHIFLCVFQDQETNLSGGEEGGNSDSSLERRLVATEKRKPPGVNVNKFLPGQILLDYLQIWTKFNVHEWIRLMYEPQKLLFNKTHSHFN